MPGHVENAEDCLQQADCFVLPSVSHESCPAVLAEAMASGLPLITSDFGPLAEVNLNGETGLVVPMHDPKALADAIRTLADAPKRCRDLGQAGRARAVEHFSRDAMIDKTLAIYESLVR